MTVVRPQPRTLALDLEGTLISNAMSCFPRPGLRSFLEQAGELFPRVVMFSAVAEPRLRAILQLLAAEGAAPPWLAACECVPWEGEVKDLRFIPGAAVAETLLVDDLEAYILPEQREQWVPIAPFASPYPDTDRELTRIAALLRTRMRGER